MGRVVRSGSCMDTRRIYGGSERLARVAGSLAGSSVSGTAYWVYLTQIREDMQLGGNVSLHCTTVGAGTQVAEVCLASSPSGPNRASKQLTRIVASNSLLTLTAGVGLKRATGPLTSGGVAADVAAGTHLWIGFRQAMQTTQAIFWSLAGDKMNGEILVTAGCAALDTIGTVTGALVAAAVTAQAPDVNFTID